jgi:hypothetical protein
VTNSKSPPISTTNQQSSAPILLGISTVLKSPCRIHLDPRLPDPRSVSTPPFAHRVLDWYPVRVQLHCTCTVPDRTHRPHAAHTRRGLDCTALDRTDGTHTSSGYPMTHPSALNTLHFHSCSPQALTKLHHAPDPRLSTTCPPTPTTRISDNSPISLTHPIQIARIRLDFCPSVAYVLRTIRHSIFTG